jgi:hypothetical protein
VPRHQGRVGTQQVHPQLHVEKVAGRARSDRGPEWGRSRRLDADSGRHRTPRASGAVSHGWVGELGAAAAARRLRIRCGSFSVSQPSGPERKPTCKKRRDHRSPRRLALPRFPS